MSAHNPLGLWSTGILLKPIGDGRWAAHADLHDDRFADPLTIQGRIGPRYAGDLDHVIDRTIYAVEALAEWVFKDGASLYMIGDGEHEDQFYPPNWRQTIREQSERIGWRPLYQREVGAADG